VDLDPGVGRAADSHATASSGLDLSVSGPLRPAAADQQPGCPGDRGGDDEDLDPGERVMDAVVLAAERPPGPGERVAPDGRAGERENTRRTLCLPDHQLTPARRATSEHWTTVRSEARRRPRSPGQRPPLTVQPHRRLRAGRAPASRRRLLRADPRCPLCRCCSDLGVDARGRRSTPRLTRAS
jgi:hypothetical protein